MQSNNSIIKYVFESALNNDTRLGNNFRYILYRHGMTINDLKEANLDSVVLCDLIMKQWNNSCDENSKRIAEHILELISRRDNLEPWILSKAELQDVIQLISTS